MSLLGGSPAPEQLGSSMINRKMALLSRIDEAELATETVESLESRLFELEQLNQFDDEYSGILSELEDLLTPAPMTCQTLESQPCHQLVNQSAPIKSATPKPRQQSHTTSAAVVRACPIQPSNSPYRKRICSPVRPRRSQQSATPEKARYQQIDVICLNDNGDRQSYEFSPSTPIGIVEQTIRSNGGCNEVIIRLGSSSI
jgi:hypothetical protein